MQEVDIDERFFFFSPHETSLRRFMTIMTMQSPDKTLIKFTLMLLHFVLVAFRNTERKNAVTDAIQCPIESK